MSWRTALILPVRGWRRRWLESVMAGWVSTFVAMMRYIVGLPAVVDATHDELAALVGPTIQRYLVP